MKVNLHAHTSSQWTEIHAQLMRARRIALIPSRRPDGDAAGSATALAAFLAREGKDFVLFSLDPLPAYLEYLPFAERFVNNADALSAPQPIDIAVTFDSASLERAGLDEAPLPHPRPTVINIDHHRTNTYFGDLNVVREHAASTTELLYEYFRTLNIRIDGDIATSLLTGILTDTGHFAYANTTLATLSTASDLLRKGGNLRAITFHTLRNKKFETLRLWGRALSRLVWNENLNTVSTVITEQDIEECHAEPGSTEGIANFLNSLEGVRAVLVLTEEGPILKGSFRTTRDDVDVSQLAKALGGGGHRKASGFSVEASLAERNGRWEVQ